MLSGLVRDYFLAYARSGIFTQTAYLSLVLAAKEVLLCNFFDEEWLVPISTSGPHSTPSTFRDRLSRIYGLIVMLEIIFVPPYGILCNINYV